MILPLPLVVAWKLKAATFELSSYDDSPPFEDTFSPPVQLVDDLRVIVRFLKLKGTFGGGPPL